MIEQFFNYIVAVSYVELSSKLTKPQQILNQYWLINSYFSTNIKIDSRQNLSSNYFWYNEIIKKKSIAWKNKLTIKSLITIISNLHNFFHYLQIRS